MWPPYQQGTGIYGFCLMPVIIFIFLTKQNSEPCGCHLFNDTWGLDKKLNTTVWQCFGYGDAILRSWHRGPGEEASLFLALRCMDFKGELSEESMKSHRTWSPRGKSMDQAFQPPSTLALNPHKSDSWGVIRTSRVNTTHSQSAGPNTCLVTDFHS